MTRSREIGGAPDIGAGSRHCWGLAALLLFVLLTPSLAQEEDSSSMSSSPSPSRPTVIKNNSSPIDPSENVKALSEAANKRQDDLRLITQRMNQFQLDASEKINELRYKQTQELATALASRLSDEAKLRSEYTDRLAIAEAKRIDAIRAVDVNAVAVANERATATATALAKTVADSASVLSAQVTRQADDLRVLVKTTADESNRNLQQQFSGINTTVGALSTRITTLEQSGAEGKGKQTFQDPVIAQLLTEFRSLANRDVSRSGVDTGRSDVIGWVIGGASFLIMLLIGIGGLFIRFNQPRST